MSGTPNLTRTPTVRQIAALAWKEWRETRWLLAAGLALLLGVPLFEAWRTWHGGYRRFEVVAAPLVTAFGGVSALLFGVAAGGRDLGGRLPGFWRAMPVGVGRWWAVKYAVGLAAVLTACCLPVAVEWVTNPGGRAMPDKTTNLLGVWPGYWAAVYSLGFLAAGLIRRPGQALVAAVAAVLLLHVLPLLLPPLARFGVPDPVDYGSVIDLYRLTVGGRSLAALRPDQVPFVVGMVVVAAAAFVAAAVAVRREWTIRSGRRSMFAAVGVAGVLLFGSAAYQLATNLPVLAEAPLDPGERVLAIHTDGSAGVVFTQVRSADGNSLQGAVRALTVGPNGLVLGPPVMPAAEHGSRWAWAGRHNTAWLPSHPDVAYVLWIHRYGNAKGDDAWLSAVVVSRPAAGGGGTGSGAAGPPVDVGSVRNVAVVSGMPDAADTHSFVPDGMFGVGDRLYVTVTGRTATFDVSSPATPKLLSVEAHEAEAYVRLADGKGRSISGARVRLAPLPDAAPRVRLSAATAGRSYLAADGDDLCTFVDPGLVLHRLTGLSAAEARYDAVARWEPSALEAWVDGYWGHVTVAGRRAYLTKHEFAGNGRSASARLAVVDFRDPARPRTAGHFAVPADRTPVVRPLADGRALVGGGEKLYLVGPPPG